MKREPTPREAHLVPRVLDLQLAAHYLSVSPDVIRLLLHKGLISRVKMPVSRNPRREHLRDLLFDRIELDAVVETWLEKVVPEHEAA